MKLRLEATEEDCDKAVEIFGKLQGIRVKSVSAFHPNTAEIGKVSPITGRMYIELKMTDLETGEIV